MLEQFTKTAASRAKKDAISFLEGLVGRKKLKNLSPEATIELLNKHNAPQHLSEAMKIEKGLRGGPKNLIRSADLTPGQFAQHQLDTRRYFSGRHAPKSNEIFIPSTGSPEMAFGEGSSDYVYRGNPIKTFLTQKEKDKKILEALGNPNIEGLNARDADDVIQEAARKLRMQAMAGDQEAFKQFETYFNAQKLPIVEHQRQNTAFVSRHPDVAAGYAAQGTIQNSSQSNLLYRYKRPKEIVEGAELEPQRLQRNSTLADAVKPTKSFEKLRKEQRKKGKILAPQVSKLFGVNPTYEGIIRTDTGSVTRLGTPEVFSVRQSRRPDGQIGFAMRKVASSSLLEDKKKFTKTIGVDMNIYDYLEKRANIRKKYIEAIGKIADKIGGEGVDNIRQIPATAFEAFLTPIATMKEIPKYYKGMGADIEYLKGAKKKALDSLKMIPDVSKIDDASSKAFYDKNRKEIQEVLSNMSKLEREVRKSRMYTTIGLGTGYGALGYGGYKGGQTVKNYIENKRGKK